MSNYFKKRMEELGLGNTAPSSNNKTTTSKESTNNSKTTSSGNYFSNRMKELGLDRSEVDEDYINTFISDAERYLESAEDDYNIAISNPSSPVYDTRKQTANDLQKRSFEISQYLDKNKDSIDEETFNNFKSYLDEFDKASGNIRYAFYKAVGSTNDRMGWLNPDAELTPEAVAMRKEKYQGNVTKLEDLEKKYGEASKIATELNNLTLQLTNGYKRAGYGNKVKEMVAQDSRVIALTKQLEEYGDLNALKAEVEGLKAENNQYKNIHEAKDSHFIPITDEVEQIASKRDFSNASSVDLNEVDAVFREISKYANDPMVYRFDEDGNVYNNYTGKLVRPADEYSEAWLNNDTDKFYGSVVQDKLGLFLSASEDDLIEAYNRLSVSHGNSTDSWANTLRDGDVNGWKELTEDEITIYYYKLNTEGQEAAYKFLDDMTTELTRRETQKRADEISDAHWLEQIALNVASIPMNVVGGAIAFAEDTANTIQGNDINPYSRAHSWQNDASAIRTDTAMDIDKLTGGIAIPLLDFSVGDAYQALMSGADSFAGSFLGGTGYGVLMGMGAASAEMKDLYERGASTEQMFLGGILAGAAEMVFEKYSIDKFVEMGDTKSLKEFVINTLKQGGVEASEEAFTEIANTITDAIVMGSQSDWEDMGTFVKNVVNAGLGGFLSGGGMGMVGSATNYAQYAQQRTEHGQDIINEGGVDTLKQLALDMAGVTQKGESKNLTKLAGKVEKNATAKNVGKLSVKAENTIVKQNRADIQKALVEKGLTEKEAKRVAEYLGSAETLTAEQKAEIEGNESIKAVVDELLDDPKSAINERASNLMAARLGTKINASKSGELSLRNDVDVTEKVSETGKTTITEVDENGKEVTTDITIDKKNPIAKVKYVGDERVVYLNTDHGTVEASKVKYASKDEALLYEAFVDMNPAFANAVIKNYDSSVPIQTYINGMREGMILYGMHNFQAVGKDIPKNTFLADLSEADQAFALKLGRAYAKADAKNANKDLRRAIKNAAEKAKASEGATTSEATQNKAKKGKVSFEDGAKAETHKQHKKIISLAKHLAKAIGIDIVFYDSRITGKKAGQGANGYYDADTDTIYLDLQNAKDDAKTIAYTLSHELVHFIKKWSPQKFNTFAEFLMEQYASHGVSAANLLKKKMVELNTTDADLAYEEMIADACETMLLDSNAMVKLMELRKSDLELFEKIKLHILKILNDIREAYKSLGYQPSSDEAKALLGMKDVLEKFYSMFEEAAVDATKNYQALGTEGYNEFVAKSTENANKTVYGEASVDMGKTESGVKHQLKAHKAIGEASIAYNERHKKVHKAILQVGIESMYEMAEAMLPYLEEEGILPPDIPGKTIFKNGSYGKTGENTTLCVRTLTYEDFKDRVAEKLGRPLTVSESLLVSQKIYDIATEPQCIYCYVAADRKAYDENLGEYWKAMDKYIKAMRKGGDSKALYTEYLAGRKDTSHQRRRWSLWESIAKSGKEYISASDLTTKRKRDGIIARKNAFSEQIKDAQRYAQNASWAKTVCDYRAYKGDILKMTSKFVDMLNSEYGLRMYSFSDYTPAFIVENMQMIIDASVKGLKSLAYTKDTDYAEIFASTGQAINVSCFAKWDAEKGTFVEDNRQGANWETTKNLRKQYRNVGAVMVATNDAMVEWALKQDWVDVVIPYHIVKTGTTIANEYQWNNYTSESADKVGSKNANIYPTEHNNDFATYSNLLKERGITPRFSRWYDKVASGELTEEQYMKLVNEVRLPASELSPVVPSFNLDAAKKSFGIDNEGKVIEGGFVDKGGYMGGWYRQGVDVNQEVMAVSEDIKAGKSSLDVEYGMSKAGKERVEQRYKKQAKKGVTKNGIEVYETSEKTKSLSWKQRKAEFLRLMTEDYRGRTARFYKNGHYYYALFDEGDLRKSIYGDNQSTPLGHDALVNQGADGSIFDLVENSSFDRGGKERGKKNKMHNGVLGWDYFVKAVQIDGVVFDLLANVRKKREGGFVYSFKLEENNMKAEPPHIPSQKDGFETAERSALGKGSITQPEPIVKRQLKKSASSQYAPTFYSQMGREIDAIKMEKIGASSLVNYLKGKGIKHDEIKWSGIEAFLEGKKSVTKAELQEFVAGSQLQIAEQMSGEDIDLRYDGSKRAYNLYDSNGKVIDTFTYNEFLDGYVADSDEEIYSNDIELREALRDIYGASVAPRWAGYRLDGGSNYRELVFQLPNSTYTNNAMKAHWGEDGEGVLVHARIQDMTTLDGKRMLFIEELQSDWHNEGAKDGYADRIEEGHIDKLKAKADEAFFNVEDYSVEMTGLAGEWETIEKTEKGSKLLRDYREAKAEYDNAENAFFKKTPDAPFRDTYHEYVLKRLLRMAAEEGYDSIGWTPAYIQSERWSEDYEEGYRIEYDQDIPKFLRKYGKKWGATVGKAEVGVAEHTVNGEHYDAEYIEVWSMDITDSMTESVLYEGQAKFQKKKLSNRTILANALETTAQNDIEKNKLAQYKEKIALIESEEEKLAELRGKIKELSFAPGRRDTEAIKKLQFEANQTANRINTYDRQLLNLESTTALKGVLAREKELVRKRTEEKGREALDAYREKMTKTQRELLSRYKDQAKAQRERTRETHDKGEAKDKLQKLILKTIKWLSYPSKEDVKCPDILKEPYKEFLESIDLSSKRLQKGGDPTQNDLRLASAMNSLATAIEKVKTAQNPNVTTEQILDSGYLDLPENFVELLRTMAEDIKKKMASSNSVVNDMHSTDVKALTKLIRTLNHAIKEMSTLYANLRFANVQELGNDSVSFLESMGKADSTNGVKDFVEWDNALPYYAFKRFGEGGESIFEGLMDAQDKLARLAEVIFGFKDKTWTDKEANEWGEDTHTITLPSGHTLTLTTADAMSIYCLSRRDNNHGMNHLLAGGVRVIGIKKGAKKANDSHSTLTQEDVIAIVSSLTDRQRAVAEAIQSFMSSVCSEWGNEISMKRFLTKEFNERFYFPIESNDENLDTKDPSAQQSDLYRLLNISATKPLTPGANNEVIIRNIFDVFTNHSSDMARLNSFGMALLDYMKWLNYREKSINEENGQITVRGVRKAMTHAYGEKAKSYVINLIKDINGRHNDNADNSFLMSMMRMSKTAAVGNNLRVAFLQFTSYPRASMVLSTGSLAKGLTRVPQIEKAKKYCGIALWKSFGFYDTNIARSIEDQIKGATNIRQKIIELSMKAPELADAITWGALWNACEYEVAKTTKNKVGSEEFYQEVGAKLREVVYATQVVDSVLTRSQIMRSKSGLTQTATAYMSEPTLTANILMDAGFQFQKEKRITGSPKTAWKKTGKIVGRAVANYCVLQLLTSIAESLADAWRDDDDEEFGEKFLEAFKENLITNIIPFNKLPIISDIAELILSRFGIGFVSSDNMATTWITQIAEALDVWTEVLGEAFGGEETSKTVYNAIYKTAKAISSMTGVSVSGAMREVVTLWNNTAGAYDSTLKIRMYESTNEELGNELYEAIVEGNDRQAESLEAQFDDQKAIDSALRKALRVNDPRIKEAAQADVDGDVSEYNRIVTEILDEGNFSEENIKAAIKAEINELTEDEEETPSTPKKQSIYEQRHYYQAVSGGNTSLASEIKEDIISTDVANGESRKDAEESFTTSFRSYVGKLYKNGEVNRSSVSNMLTQYGGYDANETYWKLKEWDFDIKNGEDASYSKYTDFYDAVKTGRNIKAVIKEYTDHGVETKTLASQITSYYKPLYKEMSNYERASIKGYILNAYALLGYDRNKKSKDIDKWLED